MRVTVTADYRGVLTGERFYPAGEYVVGDEMPQPHADALVHEGRAILLEADTQPEPPAKVKAVKRGRKGGL